MRSKEELKRKINKEVEVMKTVRSDPLPKDHILEMLAMVVVALAEMPEENRELLREIKAKIRQIQAEMEVD